MSRSKELGLVFCNSPQTTDAEGQTQDNGSLQRGKFCRSSWGINQKDEVLQEDCEVAAKHAQLMSVQPCMLGSREKNRTGVFREEENQPMYRLGILSESDIVYSEHEAPGRVTPHRVLYERQVIFEGKFDSKQLLL